MSKITDVVMVVWGVMKVGCDVVTLESCGAVGRCLLFVD